MAQSASPIADRPSSSSQDVASFARSAEKGGKSYPYAPATVTVNLTNMIWIWAVVVLIGSSIMAAGYMWSGYSEGALNSCNQTPYSCSQDQVNGIDNSLAEAPVLIGFGLLLTGIGIAATIVGVSQRLGPKNEVPFEDYFKDQ